MLGLNTFTQLVGALVGGGRTASNLDRVDHVPQSRLPDKGDLLSEATITRIPIEFAELGAPIAIPMQEGRVRLHSMREIFQRFPK